MTAEIFRDTWGIPHLRADGVNQLARAQGRVTALDRGWQLEVERHRVQGTTAAFLGAEALPWDRFARRARLEDTARRCFARLEATDPETARWVRAYVDGVNEALPEGAHRAPEFTKTGLSAGRWEPWTPFGVWLGTHILFAGFPAKLWREQVLRHLGADAVGLFAADRPGTSGSNGWLVSGARTVTGQAIIAGDPHRLIEDPGVYQQIHLSCPEFDVIGLAVPGVPGIAHFGHTGTVAWAITNAMADYQDLYRERLRRTGAGVQALEPDGEWRHAARHTEVVEVAGEGPVEVEVIETARGPVVIGGPEGLPDAAPDGSPDVTPAHHPDPGTHLGADSDSDAAVPPLAMTLRYPPRVTADLGFSALLPLLRARRVADIDGALDLWSEPVNVVQAADTEGGLLHRVAGKVPVRSAANGIRPVPAWEPGHAWRGWHQTPRGQLADGVAVMANQRGLATPLGVEFAAPHRADRITALLKERAHWSAADMPAIHRDTRLASAKPLLELLRTIVPDQVTDTDTDTEFPTAGDTTGTTDAVHREAARIRRVLLDWDRHMDADSEAAALFAAVRGAVVRRLAAHPALAVLTAPPAYPEVFQPWLALLPRVGLALENLLRAKDLYGVDRAGTVREALTEVARNVVAEPALRLRTWGDTHRLAPWRALTGTPYDEPGLSGDHDCVLCTSTVPGLTDRSARGPAARYVWDLADRGAGGWLVPFGAQGVPGSPHHRDQLPLWIAGELVPVVTDFEELEKESDA